MVEEVAVAHVGAVRPGHRGQAGVRGERRAAGGGALRVDQRASTWPSAGATRRPVAAAAGGAARRRGRRGAGRGADDDVADDAGAQPRTRDAATPRTADEDGGCGRRRGRRLPAAGDGRRGDRGRRCRTAADADDADVESSERDVAAGARRASSRRRSPAEPVTGPSSAAATAGVVVVTAPRSGERRTRPVPETPGADGSTSAGAAARTTQPPGASTAARCGSARRGQRSERRRPGRTSGGPAGAVVHGGPHGMSDHDSLSVETNGARKRHRQSPTTQGHTPSCAPERRCTATGSVRGQRDQAPWGRRRPAPDNPEEHAAGERRLAQHRHGRRLRPDRRRLLRRRDRPGLPPRVAGARAWPRAAAAAARPCSSCSATPTASSPPSRSASRWPGFFSAAFGASTLSAAAGRLAGGPGRAARASPAPLALVAGHHRDQLPVAGRRRADAQAAGAAAGRGLRAARRRAAQRDRQAVPAGHLAAVEVHRTCWSGCSAATRRSAASRSARRSSATWSPRTSRSAATSAGSSTRSSAPASARCARS